MKKTYIIIFHKKNTNTKMTIEVKAWNSWCAMVKAGFQYRDMGFTHEDIVGVVDNNV